MNKFNCQRKNTRTSSFHHCCTILRSRRCGIICTCFFTKLNFLSCVPPLIRLLKKNFTKLNFLSCVPPLIRLLKKIFTKLIFHTSIGTLV